MSKRERLVFIDSCISTHESRTRRLCQAWIGKYMEEHQDAEVDVIDLSAETVLPLNRERILARNELIQQEDWENPMFNLARRVKAADEILVGAPYWDCSFPSILKVFVENIVVEGLTFEMGEDGYRGLCPARRLTYITTSGGPIGEMDLGYDYMKGIGGMLGIESYEEYRVEGLDIWGADVDRLMEEGLERIRRI